MNSRTSSRGRSLSRTRSPSPLDHRDAPRSPRRSISPRSRSRSRSRSASLTPRRRRSLSHSSRSYSRSLSRSRSPSPVRSSKIVIEKLSKNVNEAHLAEIFGAYGAITNLEVPLNRQFMTNRGTAYIQYTTEADADAAIAHMHEAQLDGAVISVSIVLPRSRRSPLPPPRRGRAGGGRFGYSGRRSPVGRGGRSGRGGRNLDTYRPRSMSRSRSPRRHRSRSRSTSRSRSPPRRGGGARRRRSPSYSSYDSYDDKSRSVSRSRSRSRDRGPRGRGR